MALTLVNEFRGKWVQEFLTGVSKMLQTITMGSCVSVQGTFVRQLPNGRVSVRVGSTVYTGVPVTQAA